MSKQGIKDLETKLTELAGKKERLEVKLEEIVQLLGTRDSQFHTFREELVAVKRDITVLNDCLKRAESFDDSDNSQVELGNRVKLVNHKYCYDVRIVSSLEADPSERKISSESPMGLSVLGQKLGAIVEILTPQGAIKFNIVDIA